MSVPSALAAVVEAGRELFPGHVGVEFVAIDHGVAHARLDLRHEHGAPNGYLHAGVIVTLADTVCGCGCLASLPEGATGFTTIELKTSFIAKGRNGSLECEGRLVHGGRTTQVWDATVSGGDRALALFRCTQLILYPA